MKQQQLINHEKVKKLYGELNTLFLKYELNTEDTYYFLDCFFDDLKLIRHHRKQEALNGHFEKKKKVSYIG